MMSLSTVPTWFDSCFVSEINVFFNLYLFCISVSKISWDTLTVIFGSVLMLNFGRANVGISLSFFHFNRNLTSHFNFSNLIHFLSHFLTSWRLSCPYFSLIKLNNLLWAHNLIRKIITRSFKTIFILKFSVS